MASAAWPLRAALAAIVAGAFLGIGIDPLLALCVSFGVAALASAAWPASRLAALTRSLQADDAATRDVFGWSPPVPVAEGLARTARAFAEQRRSRQ